MSSVKLVDICNGIRDTLMAAEQVEAAQGPTELTEGYQDLPLLQVYPQSGETDIAQGNERSTFRAGVRQTEFGIVADVVVCQRSASLAEDMEAFLDVVEGVTAKLEGETVRPFFGQEAVKAFRWRWERVLLTRGDEGQPYLTMRVSLTVRVF